MYPEIQNYIFDFYGTLVDIWTDEASLLLWKRMATYYGAFGASYKLDELTMRYQELCREESEKAARENGSKYPEPDLGVVFRRLLTEKDPEKLPNDMDTWIRCTASMFRIISACLRPSISALVRLSGSVALMPTMRETLTNHSSGLGIRNRPSATRLKGTPSTSQSPFSRASLTRQWKER